MKVFKHRILVLILILFFSGCVEYQETYEPSYHYTRYYILSPCDNSTIPVTEFEYKTLKPPTCKNGIVNFER